MTLPIGTCTTTKERAAGADGSEAPHPRHRVPWRVIAGLLAVVAIVYFLLRLGRARHDVATAFTHLGWDQVPWLLVAFAAESLSFLCYALVQRRLLMTGGARLSRRTMLSLAVAATGLTNLVPGGTAPASGWLVGQYRRRRIPMPLALWAVLAGGFAAGVSVLLLLLIGAAVAGLLGPIQAVGCAAALAAGAFGLLRGAHALGSLSRWLERHHARRGIGLARRAAEQTALAMRFRASPAVGVHVLGLSIANWAMDVFVLVAAFGFLGLRIPWSAVLFAYATAQVAGSLAPVPGGIGFVEGGMIGAFALAGAGVGPAVAATVVYRVVTSWLVAVVGSITLAIVSRRHPVPAILESETTGHDLAR